jgi:sterol desaturase/sphingolipid hydroxylase (fatty acid hydroxylase superfamily)
MLDAANLTIETAVTFGWRVVGFLGRNIVAEWPFYAALALAFLIVLAADLRRRRAILQRYSGRGVRTDAVYAVVELTHVEGILILAPAAAALNAITDAHAPWLRIDAIASLPLAVQLIIAMVAGDFVAYWAHRLAHSNPWVWQLHKVHHAQRDLTILTRFRFPLLDRLWSMLLLFPIGVVAGSPELPVLLLAARAFRSCIEHSGLDWSFGKLGWLIVSPRYHGLHHSIAPEHHDRNFGGLFTIWDRMFGTYAGLGSGPLRYGIADEKVPESYLKQLWWPLVGMAALVRERLAKRQPRARHGEVAA